MKKPFLTIVVPCYNEEEVLDETTKQLTQMMESMLERDLISDDSKILYVDDGSKDATWSLISEKTADNRWVTGVKLSRNFGHQGALLAGLNAAYEKSDCIVSIDADLQDDVRVIADFLEKFREGYDVVYGVRGKRDTDTFFKRNTALAFYRFMERIGVKLVPNHADYRLLSKRALKEFLNYKEENMFIRGIIPLLGFKSTKVYYDRNERFAGESKYPLKKMISFAVDGITSFSIAPIRMLLALGFVMFAVGIGIGIYALVQKIMGQVTAGWTSLMISVWIVGGIQLLAIGVLGEYIGKIFKEVKGRPRYTIEENLYAEKVAKEEVRETKISSIQ
ncbi:glycosyl transferase [Listeria floridensis FSL S10-1187]|uniref:Glycosyl transferase n=1 Tax=Listeria floridensis FSL S10-1187 TaxID=1265817 RepID=A0ABP3AXC1_9LIST|nr:glycosyltransferase family 2 protein [Listeria floridensis]EUJ27466.1 glycosyl transferase [Listeria floridensis FSL S10-1187]